jgi:hypothetical protein
VLLAATAVTLALGGASAAGALAANVDNAGGDAAGQPLIGVLTAGDQALVKEGSLDALWNDEYSGAAQVTVAG